MRSTTTIVSVWLLASVPAMAGAQERFPSPEKAAAALVTAARQGGSAERLNAILGPEGGQLTSSGDPVDDAAARKRFSTAAAGRTRIERTDDKTAILHIGRDDWPFPIPLVRVDKEWQFDTAAGKQELLNRRIGRNELATLSVCRTYVSAQYEYAARFKTYARVFRSSPGQHDGLYWVGNGEVSPLGPLVADANAEGYSLGQEKEQPTPYHGYLFRILTAQGPHAPGGARDYVKDGRMTGGFALVAWPAVYGSSGVMTFLVSHDDVVFQKNLGEATSEAAKAITTYDPDASWEPTR